MSMGTEEIKKILEDKRFQKVLGAFFVNLKLLGAFGTLRVEFRKYQGDTRSERQGMYVGRNWFDESRLNNTLLDEFYGYIDKITDYYDENGEELDFDVDYDEVSYEEYSLAFDFKEKEFTFDHSYSYYSTDYQQSEREFDNLNDQTKEEIDEFCSANVYLKVSFQGSGDSGFIEDNGYNQDEEQFPIPGGLEDTLYNMLSAYGGWEINEGSQGDFTVSCMEKLITLEYGQNYEEIKSNEVYRSKLNYELSRPQR
jgi:hypothetical protein